ncbi:MAG: phosphate/phosphite/phosphonate ABC transporter substrate-binding protein [Clostridiaceae bacterium]|nr:phosphate/phosphite/phosphonate ABC transporter substrate-binding protein [Clostridiaceae bacterium]
MKMIKVEIEKVSIFKKNVLLFGFISMFLLTLGFMTGCSSPQEASTPESEMLTSNESLNEDDGRSDWPSNITLALLPTEDMEVLGRRYEPLTNYLEERLGVEITLHFPQDYTATVEAMRGGHVDISTFGPFAFVMAHERAGAEPLATRLQNPSDLPYYEAYFITRKDTGIEKVSDLKGVDFAFADPASASGHLFPKSHIMSQMGLALEEIDNDFFRNIVFSGSHEASFLSVLNGDVDAASIYDRAWYRFMERNQDHPNINDMVVFEKSEPIPNSPFTARGDLPESFKLALREAMIDLISHADDPQIAAFLEENSALGGYVETDMASYQIVIDTANRLEIDPGN